MIYLEQGGGLDHDLEQELLENVESQMVLDYDVDNLAMKVGGCLRNVEFDEKLGVVELQHQISEPAVISLFNINHELN